MYNRSLSMMKLLLVAVVTSSMFCGTSAYSDFFLVGSDLASCVGISKLHTTRCNESDDMEVHCVLDEAYRLGIGCLTKIWVPRENCPFYRKDYGVLDFRSCVAEASACPNNAEFYLSTDVYKYPVCLQENTTARGNAMTTVGINEIHLSSHGPWSSVGPIFLGLLIVAVIMLALLFLLLWKIRNRLLSYRLSDPNEPCIPQVHNYKSLPTSQEDCHQTMDNTLYVIPMDNTNKFKDNPPPIVSTWPKANALERGKSILQLNPAFLPEPGA